MIKAAPRLDAKEQRSQTRLLQLCCLYAVILISSAFFIVPHFDSFYYLDWSRHLAASYYDGPPLVAYLLRGFTTILGFKLYTLVLFGVATALLSAYCLYQAARALGNRHMALMATALWLFSPLTFQCMVRMITYDNPLILFWISSIVFCLHYIRHPKNRYLYGIGISIGLCLLSKYSAIILVFALLIFITLSKKQRQLFKNPQFYLSILMALAIFSPALIWNSNHHWISFTYQLSTHQIATHHSLASVLYNIGKMIVKNLLPMYNLLLIIVVIGWIKTRKTKNIPTGIQFLITLLLTFTIIYLIVSSGNKIRSSWLFPITSDLCLLSAYYCDHFQWRKTFNTLLILSIITSAVFILGNTLLATYVSIEKPRAIVIHKVKLSAKEKTLPLFSDGWLDSRIYFFLPGHPQIYTLPSCKDSNEYRYWSESITKKIRSGRIPKALYIDLNNNPSCMKAYFSRCIKLRSYQYAHKKLFSKKSRQFNLSLYACDQPITKGKTSD